jgi:hypothetical protein
MVAEIMNAGLGPETASIDLMNNTSPGKRIAVTGVWRIWFEHPSPGDQTQGDAVDVPANSNPDHVFEIHPITNFGGQDIDSSFVPIVDPKDPTKTYAAYSASVAFAAYDKLRATIKVSDTAVSITAKKAGYNYTEFMLEPTGKPEQGDNGIFVLANVYDSGDEETPVTEEPHRMVFVENTEPARQLKALPAGQRLHVLGIPRVNLAEVAAVSGSDEVNVALPYEMIIVAVLPDGEATTSTGRGEHTPKPTRREKKPADRSLP